MIKKFKIILVVNFLFCSSVLALSPEYEKQMYIGCYGNSKIYLGAEKAKIYCLCTINSLSEKYSDTEINAIFKKKPEEIYNDWIKSIQPYCFQGGKGYKINYSGTIPHHLCIKPDYYKIVSTIPDKVVLSAFVCDNYITISSKCEDAYWSN